MRYDEDPYPGNQHKLPSRSQASGAPGPRYPQDVPPVRDDMHPHPREHLSHSGRYQTRQAAEASGSGAAKASNRYSHGRTQAPDIGPSGGVYPTAPHPQSHHPHHHPHQHQHQHQHQNRQYRQQQQQDRRDRPLVEESHDEQGSRSRPRASATAAVIGRLENVQARGHELLNAMRTSFALDPEEVRTRSARDIRSSALYHEDVEDDRYTPYHENLPYWPSRSRFSLELSIPTAYLTTEGLLRGSIQKKHSSMPLTSSSGRSSESPSHGDWGRDSPHHRPSSQQQQHQQRQSRHHAEYQQPRQPGSSQQQAQDPQRQDHSTPAAAATTTAAATAATTTVAPNTTTATATTPNTNTNLAGSGATGVVGSGSGTVSTPRPLRRSGKPIQFEKLASRTGDLDRLRQAQEESLRPQYQSFQSGTPEFGVSEPPASDLPKERFQPLDQYGQQRSHARSQQQPRMTDRDWDRDNSPQPRKSRSYPPPPPSKGRVHRRRLSSNDRLQLRMNPRAGDVLNYLPDLFPSKSISALLVPEYISSSSGTSSVGSHTGSSISTEDDERSQVYGYGGSGGVDLGGRQSRLQKRPHKSYRHYHSETKRHQSQRHQQYYHQQHGMSGPSSRSRRREARGSRVHPQHFNFKVNCQLQLTPELMAACMVENISIEVWKLNSKRQTMIELGSAKLPLHKVFSRIMQKTATMSTSPLPAPPSGGSRYHSQYRDRTGPRSGYMRPSRESNAVFKEGWRLEPSVFDIRSRQGTIIGQLDAHLWIHPRSRSDSMVSAAA
ncbi:hypothetical protein BGX34_009244 [Mortierella sp. NVP85]|nr:hypothetical protein BGX34_009244 [Mortierella sp. NVP85]